MTQAVELGDLPRHYQTAFSRGHVGAIAERSLRFNVVRAGTLALPSGQLVVCDPLVGAARVSFVQSVLPGRYPVDLALGLDAEENVEQIVFARVLFANTEPALWVKGVRRTDAGAGQEDDFGFICASGTVGLMDQSVAAEFNPQSMHQLDYFLDSLVANFKPRRSWLNFAMADDNNAIFVTAGERGRLIRTFFAVDDEGDICLALSSLLL